MAWAIAGTQRRTYSLVDADSTLRDGLTVVTGGGADCPIPRSD
jgi:hypothetical protein